MNRILQFWPPPRGGDGASLSMPKTVKAVKGSNLEAVFASHFSQVLEEWVSQDSARSDRVFAEFLGIEPRNLSKWKSDGLKPYPVVANDNLHTASEYLGVDPASWWGAALKRVPAKEFPNGYEIRITETLVKTAHKTALLDPAFRRALQDLIEKK